MQDVETLSLGQVALLRHLPPRELRELDERCAWRRVAAGEHILDRDSESRDVFYVVKGAVQVKNYSASGREIALAMITAGGFFGELAAIDQRPRSANVTATQPSVVASMPPAVFQDLLQKHPEIAMQVLQRLADVVRSADERIMDLSTLGAVQRVCVEILRLVQPDPAVPSMWSIYPFPTQVDIASRASTTRETVARVLGHLNVEGIVKRKGKTIYVSDIEKLRALASRSGRQEDTLASA
jgi:CRP-like cAMP-binding protein